MMKTGSTQMKVFLAFVAVGISVTGWAAHVRETLSLEAGWNAVYFESTPYVSDCQQFFSNELASVTYVGAYQQQAYEDTAQYDSDGNIIDQKPVSYFVWSRNSDEPSTLSSISGGMCYLVYATNKCTKTFYGLPSQPHFTWRKSSSDAGFINLVSPAIVAGSTVLAKKYFAEGPAGDSLQVWRIAGKGTSPTLQILGTVIKPNLAAGKAYAMSATRADAWPGVVRVLGLTGQMVNFGSTQTQSSFTIANAGTTNHVFRVTVRASEDESDRPLALSRFVKANAVDAGAWSNLTIGAGWDVALEAGASQDFTLGLDRTSVTDTNEFYGVLLEVADLSGTGMRVRIPVVASVDTRAVKGVSPDAGLWVGAVALNEVSSLSDKTPLPSAGTMKLTALVHVDKNGRPTLLPRIAVAYGLDTNATSSATLFRELEDVPDGATSKRRLTSLLMPTSASSVQDPDEDHLWNEWSSTFTYAIDARAADNPFRHAWHPDHDGINALYDGYSASETWAVTNVLTFAWQKSDGTRYYAQDADGLSAGVVTWEIRGIAKNPLVARGMFSFKKILTNETIEKGEDK